MKPTIDVIAAVNSDAILAANLMRSPDVAKGVLAVTPVRGEKSAGRAYNRGMDGTHAALVAFIHQDVYLPAGWRDRLLAAVDRLAERGEPWGVLGVWGVTQAHQFCGRVWCSGSNHEHMGVVGEPREVASVDEIVLVTRREGGLRFDPELPGFHLYATDLALAARAKGLKTFVFDGPVVHNSRCNPQPFDAHYRRAYRYMRRKWAAQLPLKTCCVDVTPWGMPLHKQWLRNEVARLRGRVVARPPLPDSAAVAVRLGYETSQEGAA